MVSERVQRQIERLLDEAEEAVARLDWDTVRARAQAVLAFDPENSDGLDFLAAAERAVEDVSEPSPQATVSALPPSAPSQPLPAFFKDGRYMVKEFLGEGAHKRVYLVHDTLIDRDVAFALIKTETLDDIGRQRILREAQTMGRLGEHTNLVPIYEFGDESGQLFMVIPAMTHGSVTDLIRQSEDRRVGLDRIVEIATDVCKGLEFLHSREVVHRDLKPSNVWLSESGTARLGDFGLAVSSERSSLTNEGMAVGTVSYMAPEQAMGGEIDARSDLYSLGCMLYEMVTGAPPFQGSDPVAIIGQHVNTPPVAPSRRNSSCPRLLDSLILKLLSKDPSDRPHSASEVAGILEAIDPGDSADFSGGDSGRSNALDSLASGVFVGRDQEMAELRTALDDALSGRGCLAMLVGEPGIGKTRMASELETYANLRGVKVLWGRCHEQQGMPPFWPWVQAIRSYVLEREPELLRSDMGAGASTIAEIVSDVNEFLPELNPLPELDNPEQ
ncbi:MAG: serine/threonine-protein kinase, partial [SAR202 cluster bacterium]|nr:serine/threonine-protein kinase [SAR202 cluster bacterium]